MQKKNCDKITMCIGMNGVEKSLSASEGERRNAKRRVARRSTASFYSDMGKQNDIITREILICTMRFNEQKVVIFRCRTDVRDEPAWPEPAQPEPARPGPVQPGPTRPWHSLRAYFSNVLKYTSLKLFHNVFTGFKIVV